jgi:hypothetical protein
MSRFVSERYKAQRDWLSIALEKGIDHPDLPEEPDFSKASTLTRPTGNTIKEQLDRKILEWLKLVDNVC